MSDANHSQSVEAEAEHTRPRPLAPARPRGTALARVAAVLALLAIATTAALWWQVRAVHEALGDGVPATAELMREVERLVDERGREQRAVNERLQRRLDELAAAQADAREALFQRLDAQRRASAEVRELIDRVPGRFRELEAAILEFGAVSGETRQRWLLAEAEYFLRTAEAELRLGGGIERALRAVALAQARLGATAVPVQPVREALAAERAALEAAAGPVSRDELSRRLAALAQRIDALPLAEAGPPAYAIERPVEPAEAAGGVERAWSVLRGVLAAMFRVQRSDSPPPALTGPEEAFLLRRNLELQLTAAQLALLQQQAEAYRGHLRTAGQWLETWFATGDAAVQRAQRELTALAAVEIAPRPPEFGEALRRLRTTLDAGEAGR